jgi:hypothetical protein
MSRRREERRDLAVYRPRPGLSPPERTAEQDAAAGGRDNRIVRRPDGGAVVASIALRIPPNSRRVYAYLRWSVPGAGTRERYVGEVSAAPDRSDALRLAWSLAANPRIARSA